LPTPPALQALKAQGRLSLDKVMEIREAGVDVASVLGEDARQQLYRTEVGRGRAGGAALALSRNVHNADLRGTTASLLPKLGKTTVANGTLVACLLQGALHPTMLP
jgi:hypothetical protein